MLHVSRRVSLTLAGSVAGCAGAVHGTRSQCGGDDGRRPGWMPWSWKRDGKAETPVLSHHMTRHTTSSLYEQEVALVPLSERYVGTRVERSPRAKMLMADEEVEACAKLINDLVDLAFFDEEDEQEIFEFSVCHVVEVLSLRLPNRIIGLVHSSKRMPAEDAAAFERHIFPAVLDKVDLFFLDELDRRCVVRCVVKLIMRSMCMCKEPIGGHFTVRDRVQNVLSAREGRRGV